MKTGLLAAALALALIAGPAEAQMMAQMMLPGALQAAPEGAPKTAGPAPADAARPKPAAAKPPGEDAILDRDLARNGADGQMRFRRAAGGLEITVLSLAGEQIAHRGEACRLDVVADAPIAARAAGRPKGLLRYEVAVAACPFTLDVLDGAVLVAREAQPCEFAAADCRVDPTGLWGPQASAIDEKQAKEFERARGAAEASMRTGFRALLASAGADKTAVKAIASEQAGFSSAREVVCRGYAREDTVGYCALRLTQARIFALQAEMAASVHGAPAKARAPKAEKKSDAKP